VLYGDVSVSGLICRWIDPYGKLGNGKQVSLTSGLINTSTATAKKNGIVNREKVMYQV